jgi:DNA-binding transcriptional MerR regulator
MSDAALFSIKQVSERTALPPHVLRYYEREGLLPGISRSRKGIRRYSGGDLEWLSLIRCLKSTGMSIKQIRDFVELSSRGDETLIQRGQILRDHKTAMEAQILDLQTHLQQITRQIEDLSSREAYPAQPVGA